MSNEIEVIVGTKKYKVMRDRLYTNTDEWALVQGEYAIVGITDYAQKELKDIVSVELPEVGRFVRKGEEIGAIDSIKATSSYYAPLSGEIVEVNKELETAPELLNKDPYGSGWIVKIKISNPEEISSLLSPEQYAEKIKRH